MKTGCCNELQWLIRKLTVVKRHAGLSCKSPFLSLVIIQQVASEWRSLGVTSVATVNSVFVQSAVCGCPETSWFECRTSYVLSLWPFGWQNNLSSFTPPSLLSKTQVFPEGFLFTLLLFVLFVLQWLLVWIQPPYLSSWFLDLYLTWWSDLHSHPISLMSSSRETQV